jgi:glycosyltransferase involved in cell wall biosynthesis
MKIGRMRVLMIPNSFFPDPPGGTEVGVLELAKALRQLGVGAVVAAPDGPEPGAARYAWEGISVYRYPVDQHANAAGAMNIPDPGLTASFAALLEELKPDLLSLHAWTPGVGVSQIQAARMRGMPVVVTCHLANVVCLRGSGMRWNRTPCDLVLDSFRCAACVLQSRGVPRFLAQAMSLALRDHPSVELRTDQSGIMRAVTLVHKVRRTLMNRQAWWAEIAAFMVQGPWFKPVLISNGIPEQKVQIAPTCLYRRPPPPPQRWKEQAARRDGRLVIAFLGRLTSWKGVELLARALRGIPPSAGDLEARIYGVMQGQDEVNCRNTLRRLIRDDPRIRLLEPLYGDDLLRTLATCDVLCVPSRVQDMRPQVILEAFSVGVPVIGASLGGIRDLVKHGDNGLLVPPNNVRALRAALLRLLKEPGLLSHLRHNVPSPAGIEELATFMHDAYARVLTHTQRTGACQ